MKKVLFLMAFASLTLGVEAQNPAGGFSLKPMAGVNIARLVNGTDGMYHARVKFTGGAELEYGISPWLGVSLDLLYSQQGAKIDGSLESYAVDENGDDLAIHTTLEGKLKTSYLNMPLMANIYIPAVKGLAVKAGLQVGLLTSDRMAVAFQTAIVNLTDMQSCVPNTPRESHSLQFVSGSYAQTDVCKSVDIGIPVGLSYEWKNIALDARYCFGMKKIDKTQDPDNARNGCLSITLGYRFHL